MSLYLGLDSSTQSFSAILIDIETRQLVLDHSINFNERLAEFGCKNGVLPSEDPTVAHSDPLMWLAALDMLLDDLRKRGVDLGQVAAIAGSGQQHGSVYLNAKATAILKSLNPKKPLAQQLKPALSRPTSPIWMDSSTRKQCDEIEANVVQASSLHSSSRQARCLPHSGVVQASSLQSSARQAGCLPHGGLDGAAAVAELTGSACFERFTGPQIRKFAQTEPRRYAATAKIHLVSSFMCSILVGKHAPIDPGDGAGMNLMDIRARKWAPAALKATASGLKGKLPALARSDSIVGRINPYFVPKYRFSPKCRVAAWSGDNPCSLIGVGLIQSGKVCISLGTSDTYFGAMPEPRISREGEGHVFGSPTGDYMSLICFLNGSLSREKVKDAYGLSWEQFSDALRQTPPGNGGRVMLPYFSPEITPKVLKPGVARYWLEESDAAGNVRAVVEAQMASMALHAKWMGVKTKTVYATGGASSNRAILEIMANVHNADVYQFQVGKSAALGAALRAAHADLRASGDEIPWPQVVKGFADPIAESRVRPDKAAVKVYREFLKLYKACEDHALRGGKNPAAARERFLGTIA